MALRLVTGHKQVQPNNPYRPPSETQARRRGAKPLPTNFRQPRSQDRRRRRFQKIAYLLLLGSGFYFAVAMLQELLKQLLAS